MSLTFKCQLEEFVIDLLFFPMNIKGCCFNEFRSQFFPVFVVVAGNLDALKNTLKAFDDFKKKQ